jgi:hypothetical protein
VGTKAPQFLPNTLTIALLKREQAKERGNSDGNAGNGDTGSERTPLPFFQR